MSPPERLSSDEVLRVLNELGIAYRVTEFPDRVFTAQGVADALGMKLAQVAKAVLFRTEGQGFGVAVVPGDRRVNTSALSAARGGKAVELVRRGEVERATGLPVGAVTPLVKFSKPEIEVVIDTRLTEESEVNVSTGDLRFGLSLTPDALVRAVGATIATISE